MKQTERLRVAEWLGLGSALLGFVPQAWFLLYVLLFPDGGLGGLHYSQPSVGLESEVGPRFVWGLWAFCMTPVAVAQALVLTPLACLWVLRGPGKTRRRAVLCAVALSVLTLALSSVIVAYL